MTKVYMLHPMTKDILSFFSFLRLPFIEGCIWDEDNPDILFASEWIYYKYKYFEQFRVLYDKAKLRVIFLSEAIEPDWNIFDYAIGFDNRLHYDERFIRILSPIDMYRGFISSSVNGIDTIDNAKNILQTKSRFCNFLYSNPEAHPMRDKLFYALSTYKHVDSLGMHLNNVETKGTGYEGHREECISLKSPYKFSIAAENAAYKGYTSEKIFTSLEAHTVPIYFGNPDIIEDVNPDAFINVNDFESLESLIEHIRMIDENDDLWCKMISSPWLTSQQRMYHNQRTLDYHTKMRRLLNEKIVSKLAVGYHVGNYRRHFFDGDFIFEKYNSLWYRTLRTTYHRLKQILNVHKHSKLKLD